MKFPTKTLVNLFVPAQAIFIPQLSIVARRLLHLERLEESGDRERVTGVETDTGAMYHGMAGFIALLAGDSVSGTKNAPSSLRVRQSCVLRGDGSILHAMLSRFRPRRLIEIGCGWSSACAIDTIEQNLQGQCEVTFIEPYPHLLIELIGTAGVKTTILEIPVQDAPLEIFDTLQAGDFVFINLTHVLKTGSDVCFELFEILPRLAGVFGAFS